MPKCGKKQFKFKCGELACGKLIRGDKWMSHCKGDHGYKHSRGDTIKKSIVAVKEDGGSWCPFSDQQVGLLFNLINVIIVGLGS
jgi:hypothetical protein